MLKRHLQQSTLSILVPNYAPPPLYFLKHWFAALKFFPKKTLTCGTSCTYLTEDALCVLDASLIYMHTELQALVQVVHT